MNEVIIIIIFVIAEVVAHHVCGSGIFKTANIDDQEPRVANNNMRANSLNKKLMLHHMTGLQKSLEYCIILEHTVCFRCYVAAKTIAFPIESCIYTIYIFFILKNIIYFYDFFI